MRKPREGKSFAQGHRVRGWWSHAPNHDVKTGAVRRMAQWWGNPQVDKERQLKQHGPGVPTRAALRDP